MYVKTSCLAEVCALSAFLFVSLIIFSTYAYITYQDIKELGNLKDQTVIVVKAPTDTKLEVTDPDEACATAQTSNAGDVWRDLILIKCKFK